MNKAAFFAPMIRGAIIARTQERWTVVYADSSEKELFNDAFTVEVKHDVSTENERETAHLFKERFSKEREIPARVKVKLSGEEYRYYTAPDTASIGAAKTTKAFAPPAAAPSFTAARAACVKNRVAVVTGGAQGFGEEITRGLAAGGAIVFIADMNYTGAVTLAEALNKEYGRPAAFAVEVNVNDEASVEKMRDTIAVTAGGLDLCVSNAGVLRASSILEQDIPAFRFVTDINYVAFAIVVKHCARIMKRQHEAGGGFTDIIQINSKSGLDGSNKNGAYAGSKFGSIGLVQSFAKELIEYGVKVNALCPGNFFDGPLWSDPEKGLFVQYLNTGKVPGAKTIADVKRFYEAKVPMNRGCTGGDVIRAVYYLVEQVYETGQALPVTGGQVMLN
jgi:sorbitol-6-phosphate 2-dehydrogenase